MRFTARASLKLWERRLRYRRRRLAAARRRMDGPREKKWYRKTRAAEYWVSRRRKEATPLRERAYLEAAELVGIMEQGGNNRGVAVERIIALGGGLAGQAWCGWFLAAVYKIAGSKAVEWRWGAVRLLPLVSGVSRTSKPRRGDLVRFTFDHVGMFVKDNGNGSIVTIEGNTGATGAVSDSRTGGDGVYRKVRSKQLVTDYLRITR